MIVWQGFGFLALLFPIVGYGLMIFLSNAIGGATFTQTHAWPGAVGVLLGALAVWLVGLKLADGASRTLVDPQTGQSVILRRKHTLFWMPLQYCAIIAGVIGMILLFLPATPR